MKKLLFSLFAIAAMAPLSASVVISVQEVGSDVVATASGSLDLSGLAYEYNGNPSAKLETGVAKIVFGPPPNPVNSMFYTGVTSNPTNFGSSVTTDNSSGTNAGFGVLNHEVIVPFNYVNGQAINTTAVYSNATFSSLGLTEGSTYTWSWSADTITMTVGGSAVPEPSTWASIAGLFSLSIAFFRRRRKV